MAYDKSLMTFAHNFPNGDKLDQASTALFNDLSPGGGDASKVATDITNIVAATDQSFGPGGNALVFQAHFGAMGLAELGQAGLNVYSGFGRSVGSAMSTLSGPQLQNFAANLATQISGTFHA